MSEVKKIPTFSWLLRKVEQMIRRDKAEYVKLRQAHSDKLLRGCSVRMQSFDYGPETAFHLYAPNDGNNAYATIRGARYKGEFYTVYRLECTATKYRKRMHKWLPISLPEGIGCLKDNKAIYFNADGSVAEEGVYHGGRRMRSGSPDLQTLVIRDSDGVLLGQKFNFLRQAIANEHHSNNPIDLWHGFVPNAVDSKMDWYGSMAPPQWDNHDMVYDKASRDVSIFKVDEPVWDEKRVKTLAARVHSEALRLTKAYPYIKIALIPGGRWDEKTSVYEDGRLNRFGGGIRNPVVVGRDSTGHPLMWMLPELVAYWSTARSETSHKIHEEARFFRVIIPPTGSRQLTRVDGCSPFNRTYRWGNTSMAKSNFRAGVSVERAYHQMVCGSTSSDMNGRLWSSNRHRNSGIPFWAHELDHLIHDWSESQSVVMIYDNSVVDHGYRALEPRAVKPEGIFSSIEERELVDSLPLC